MADSTQTPPPASAAQSPPAAAPAQPATPAPPPGNRRRALLIVAGVGLILLVAGFFYYQYAQTYESTDDAQVDCHLVAVASRIQGTVTAVHTDENQFVQAGEVVAEIDPRDFQVAAAQARAELTQSQADIEAQHPNVPITQTASETNISTGQAQVQTAEAAVSAAEHDAAAALGRQREAEAEERQAEANNAKAQADLERYQALVAKDEIPRTQFDQIVATAKAQTAAVDSSKAAVEAYRAAAQSSARMVDQRKSQLAEAASRLAQSNINAPQQLAISRATLRSKQAQAAVANSRVERALLDISYTNIVAPVSGVVGKRSVEIGSTVQPGQQLLTIAQIDDLWVTANFKETQLRRMGPKQRVDIKVDAFGLTFGGYVESMPGASGSITSLLPPENATGNFVKVVQRLPVRIRFNKNQSGLDRLRPGMSVEPKVWLQ